MKKLSLIFGLMLLMTAVAFGQIEPTITEITTLDNSYSEGDCVWTENAGYCYWGYYPYNTRDPNDMWRIFNLTDYSFDKNITIEFNDIIYATYTDFIAKDGVIYIISPFEFTTYNEATGLFTTLNNQSFPNTFFPTVNHVPSCDFIGDDIICMIGRYSYQPVIMRFDPDTGIPETLMTGISTEFYRSECRARNSDEVWCSFGQYTNKSLVYTVSTNTTTEKYWDIPYTVYGELSCMWYEDILYCYSFDEYDYLTDDILYYDPFTDTSGILDTSFPFEICNYDNGNGVGGVDYLIGGWAGEYWDYESDVVLKIDFNPAEPEPEGGWTPTEYNATHGISDVTGLVIDFGVEFGIQAIALAGIIALVGIAVWIRGRLR